MPVSLPNLGVSVVPGGVSLTPDTLDLPAQGVAILLGVSVTGSPIGPPPPPSFLLLVDGASFLLLVDGASKLQLAA